MEQFQSWLDKYVYNFVNYNKIKHVQNFEIKTKYQLLNKTHKNQVSPHKSKTGKTFLLYYFP